MNSEELLRENAALRERLSRQSQATLRINESLDFDTALQEALDSARALTASVIGVDTEFVSPKAAYVNRLVRGDTTPARLRIPQADFPSPRLRDP